MRAQLAAAVSGQAVIYPTALAKRWGITYQALWLKEKGRKVPERDFHVGGEAVGWKLSTIEAHESNRKAALL